MVMEKIESKLEKKINKIKGQLYKGCNGSENDAWKLNFISKLNSVKIQIHQNEINPVYILNKGVNK